MERRGKERSEFDPVAEHGSSPKKPLQRSDKPAGKPAKPAKPAGKLLEKLGKHAGQDTTRRPDRDADGHSGMRPDSRAQEHAPRGGRDGRDDRYATERMAPEQPPAEPMDPRHTPGRSGRSQRMDAGRAPGRRAAAQPVDAGHALTERLVNASREEMSSRQSGPEHASHTTNGGPRHHAAADGRHHAAPVLAERAAVAEKRLHEAVTGFVDDPRKSVEAADALLEEVATGFADALAERRRVLRDGWHSGSDVTDTEELRASLRDYRDLVDRLLHV